MKYLKLFEALRDENYEKIENVFLDFIDQGLCELEIPPINSVKAKLIKKDDLVIDINFFDLYFKAKKQDVFGSDLSTSNYKKKLDDLCKSITGFTFTQIWDFSVDQTPELEEAWEKWREFEQTTRHRLIDEMKGTFKRLQYYGCEILFVDWGDPSENPFYCIWTVITNTSQLNFDDLLFHELSEFDWYFRSDSVNKTLLTNIFKKNYNLNYIRSYIDLDADENIFLNLEFSDSASAILQNNKFIVVLQNLKKKFQGLKYQIIDTDSGALIKLINENK